MFTAQDPVGAASARGRDPGATESAQRHAGVPLPGARARAATLRRERPPQGTCGVLLG